MYIVNNQTQSTHFSCQRSNGTELDPISILRVHISSESELSFALYIYNWLVRTLHVHLTILANPLILHSTYIYGTCLWCKTSNSVIPICGCILKMTQVRNQSMLTGLKCEKRFGHFMEYTDIEHFVKLSILIRANSAWCPAVWQHWHLVHACGWKDSKIF